VNPAYPLSSPWPVSCSQYPQLHIFKNNGLKTQKEIAMNNDKLKGSVNSAVGSLKEGAGRAMDDKQMQAEGYAQKKKGQAQKLSGAVQDVFQKGKDILGIKSKKI
jgi:uncharacterized protein YjbJ (UPF0337 family)